MNVSADENILYVDASNVSAEKILSHALSGFLNRRNNFEEIVVLCIGTDRATGDSLGPLIGYMLAEYSKQYKKVKVYGTLEEPVHAKNIKETMAKIYMENSCPVVIAIDACLGDIDHIGFISLGEGNIKPGAGVKKELPAVGDIFLKGIVNLSGTMDVFILNNTRLSVVMKLAEVVSQGVIGMLNMQKRVMTYL